MSPLAELIDDQVPHEGWPEVIRTLPCGKSAQKRPEVSDPVRPPVRFRPTRDSAKTIASMMRENRMVLDRNIHGMCVGATKAGSVHKSAANVRFALT